MSQLLAVGITAGTTSTTYSPHDGTPRRQMALFLIRMYDLGFKLAVPDTSGSPSFADVGGLDQSYQNAIQSLTILGISQGTSGSTFTPEAQVTRVEMALFIHRLLTAGKISLPQAEGMSFTDVDGLSVEARNAIQDLFAVGITKGTSKSTFDPSAPVSREQMALFLARVLNLAG